MKRYKLLTLLILACLLSSCYSSRSTSPGLILGDYGRVIKGQVMVAGTAGIEQRYSRREVIAVCNAQYSLTNKINLSATGYYASNSDPMSSFIQVRVPDTKGLRIGARYQFFDWLGIAGGTSLTFPSTTVREISFDCGPIISIQHNRFSYFFSTRFKRNIFINTESNPFPNRRPEFHFPFLQTGISYYLHPQVQLCGEIAYEQLPYRYMNWNTHISIGIHYRLDSYWR